MTLIALSLSIFVVGCGGTIQEDESIKERHEYLLGGIQQLSRRALDSPQAFARVERALAQLSSQNAGCLSHRPTNIRSGSRQVVNGFKFIFVVEVERSSSEHCQTESTPSNGVSEIYKIDIYEPAGRGSETEYNFEKLATDQA